MADPDASDLPVDALLSETLFDMHDGVGHVPATNDTLAVIRTMIEKYGPGDSVPGAAGNVLYATSATESAYGPRAMIKLDEVILSGSQATIPFPSIPSTYRGLMIDWVARDISASTSVVALTMQINGDTGNNYDWQSNLANNGAITSGPTFADPSIRAGLVVQGGAGAGLFAGGQIHIPRYAGAVANKIIRGEGAAKIGTSTAHLFGFTYDGFWRNSAAITSITLLVAGTQFATGSAFTLYGLPA